MMAQRSSGGRSVLEGEWAVVGACHPRRRRSGEACGMPAIRPALLLANQYPGRDSNSYNTRVLGDFESPASTDSATRARCYRNTNLHHRTTARGLVATEA
jgi:hypothetical protein